MNNLSTTCEGGRFFPAWTIVFDERSVDNNDDDDDDYHFLKHVCQPKILDFSSIVFLDWILQTAMVVPMASIQLIINF